MEKIDINTIFERSSIEQQIKTVLSNFDEKCNDLNYKKEKIDVIGDIIGTMSYSKIKKNGFPDLGEYQNEFNVVREADLLAAYDIDRAIIYNMTKSNNDFEFNCSSRFEDEVNKYSYMWKNEGEYSKKRVS